MTEKSEKRGKLTFQASEMRTLDRKTHDAALERFYETLKDEEIVQALYHSADARVIQLLEYMFDPHYAKMTFVGLCRECGLSLGDIVDAFRDYKLSQGIVAMSRHAPAIMEDTAQDARSGDALCSSCQGTGSTTDLEDNEVPCLTCKGVGHFRVPGHDKSRELFFKTMGLTANKVPLVAQQFNFPDDRPPRVEDFVGGVHKALKE